MSIENNVFRHFSLICRVKQCVMHKNFYRTCNIVYFLKFISRGVTPYIRECAAGMGYVFTSSGINFCKGQKFKVLGIFGVIICPWFVFVTVIK